MKFISKHQLKERLSYILNSPKDNGVLEMIVIRPVTNQRKILDFCRLSSAGGAEGDNWSGGCWKSLPDGRPHPDVQITLMNYRVLELIADTDERRALSGDNLCVDLDLSDENLRSGERLKVGDAVLEVTDVPHNGCKKFKERFGADALSCVNSKQGKSLHLRGVYVRVVVDGVVKKGDRVTKIETEPVGEA